MWNRPSVPFTGVGVVSTVDTIGAKSSRSAPAACPAAPSAVTVADAAQTPRIAPSVALHRLAPSITHSEPIGAPSAALFARSPTRDGDYCEALRPSGEVRHGSGDGRRRQSGEGDGRRPVHAGRRAV